MSILFPNTVSGSGTLSAALAKKLAPKLKSTSPKVTIAPISNPFQTYIDQAKTSLLTPAAQQKLALGGVNATINSQLAASDASSKAEQSQYAALQNRAAGLAQALGSFSPEYEGRIGDAYNQAAQTIGTLGTGLTGAVASDWQNNLDTSKAAVAQALGGQGQVASYDVPGLQSTAQLLGTTMPASTLAGQAVTSRALAHYAAAADQAQAGTQVDDYVQQAQDALNQRAAERATIIAQRPDLTQQAQEQQRQDAATTQGHIDDLVSSAATWQQNKQQLQDTRHQNAIDNKYRSTQAGITNKQKDAEDKWSEYVDRQTIANQRETITHLDANGNPVGEYTRDPETGAIIPWSDYIAHTEYLQSEGDKVAASILSAKTQLNITKAKILAATQKSTQFQGFNAYESAQLHWLADKNGTLQVDAKGNPIPYDPKQAPGYKPPKVAGAKPGGLSSSGQVSAWNDATSSIDDMLKAEAPTYVKAPKNYEPGPHDPPAVNGYIPKPGTGQSAADYHTVMQTALAAIPPNLKGNKAWTKRVTDYIDKRIPMGTGGRPWEYKPARKYALTGLRAAKAKGTSRADAIANAIKHAPTMPREIIEAAAAEVYRTTPIGPRGPAVGALP